MNMDLHYMTVAADRRGLDQRAARGWMAAKADRKHQGRPWGSRLRWAIGAVLVHAGQRLQGVSIIEITTKATA